MNHGRKKIIAFTVLAIVFTVIALFVIKRHYRSAVVTIPYFYHQNDSPTSSPRDSNPKSEIRNLKSLNLPVPFTPQAPTANWDELHNEACEEASAIMAYAYFTGDKSTNLKPDYVENEIAKLTKWQQDNLGYYLDTTTAETAKMIEEVYGLKTRLVYGFSEEDIESELAQNRLVIVSEYGRDLGNPYYKRPGPVHHMLVIKGYDKDGNFITNDPGTRRGLNYVYDFKTIYDAAADWDHSVGTVDKNQKIALVVWK